MSLSAVMAISLSACKPSKHGAGATANNIANAMDAGL